MQQVYSEDISTSFHFAKYDKESDFHIRHLFLFKKKCIFADTLILNMCKNSKAIK